MSSCGRPRVDKLMKSMKDTVLCRSSKQRNRDERQLQQESGERSSQETAAVAAVVDAAGDDGVGNATAAQVGTSNDITAPAATRGAAETGANAVSSVPVVVEKVPTDAMSVTTAMTEADRDEMVTYSGLPKAIEESIMQPKLIFYINIHVLDKKKLISAALAGEESSNGAGKKKKPSFMNNFTATLGAAVLSDATVVSQLTNELLKEFPNEMKQSGVDATFEQVFTRGAMAVLRCAIFNIDFETAIASEYKDEGMQHYQKLLAAMKFFDMSDIEIQSTLDELEADLLQTFPEEIANELKKEFEKQGMEINIDCKTEDEQGAYLFQYLKEKL